MTSRERERRADVGRTRTCRVVHGRYRYVLHFLNICTVYIVIARVLLLSVERTTTRARQSSLQVTGLPSLYCTTSASDVGVYQLKDSLSV